MSRRTMLICFIIWLVVAIGLFIAMFHQDPDTLNQDSTMYDESS